MRQYELPSFRLHALRTQYAPRIERCALSIVQCALSEGERHEPLLFLRAEDVLHAMRAKPRGIERRIEAVGCQRGSRIEAANALDQRHRETRCRVHRQKERDEVRVGYLFVEERLPRRIDGAHLDPRVPKPRGRRGQPERLAAEVVRRDEKDAHIGSVPTLRTQRRAASSLGVGRGVIRLTITSESTETINAGYIVGRPRG